MKRVPMLILFAIFFQNIVTAKQWVIFYADLGWVDHVSITENSLTGHAFVSFVHNNTPNSTLSIESWGFYRKDVDQDGWGNINPINDNIRNDLNRQRDIGFMVEVNKTEFQQCQIVKNLWKNKKYSLTSKNCVHFLRDILNAINKNRKDKNYILIEPPTDYIFPSTFLSALKALNAKLAYNQMFSSLNEEKITKYNDKEFIWLTFKELPQKHQDELKSIQAANLDYYLNHIDYYTKKKCDPRFALCDFDNNGIMGYVIKPGCGKELKFTYSVIENYGSSYVEGNETKTLFPHFGGPIDDFGHQHIIEDKGDDNTQILSELPQPVEIEVNNVITPQNAKYFVWTDWRRMPDSLIVPLNNIKAKDETLYNEVMDYLESGAQVLVAVYDFDGNGRLGYVFNPRGRGWGGSHGYNYYIHNSDNSKGLNTTDYGISPRKGGVYCRRLKKEINLSENNRWIF